VLVILQLFRTAEKSFLSLAVKDGREIEGIEKFLVTSDIESQKRRGTIHHWCRPKHDTSAPINSFIRTPHGSALFLFLVGRFWWSVI
jgi:hypothetical protein